MSDSNDKNVPALLIDSELTVVEVGFNGNANGGRAFYSFSPQVIEVIGKSAKVVISLSANTPSHFYIEQLYTSDAFDQIKCIVITDDSRRVEFTHENKHKCITNFLLQVKDTKNGTIINCDPQVVNRPRPGGGNI